MIRYTLRDIPKELDLMVREEASKQNISINKAVIGLLQKGLGKEEETLDLRHDLDDLAGTWKKDPEFDAVLAEQDIIEEDLWD